MQRNLLILPLAFGILLLSGCPEQVDPKFKQAADLTSEAQQALRRGEFDAALTAIDKAIAIQPSPDRYRLRAETHLNDLPAALADIEKGLEMDPDNKLLLKWKAKFEEAMKKNGK